jgi:hypothetical protein
MAVAFLPDRARPRRRHGKTLALPQGKLRNLLCLQFAARLVGAVNV